MRLSRLKIIMIAALKVDEQRPSSDFSGEIIGPDISISIKATGQEKAADSQAHPSGINGWYRVSPTYR